MTAVLERYMTRHPHSVRTDDKLADAARKMTSLGVRHLPVVDDGALVGVLSERDVRLATSANMGSLNVREMCVDAPYAVDIETSLFVVAQEMATRKIGSTIVLEAGKVAGIFTTTDACRALADILSPSPGSA